jgi:hypothetical protein
MLMALFCNAADVSVGGLLWCTAEEENPTFPFWWQLPPVTRTVLSSETRGNFRRWAPKHLHFVIPDVNRYRLQVQVPYQSGLVN